MATYEHNALQQYKDQNGDMHIFYPVTKAENVDGLYEGPTLTGVPKAPTAEAGTNTTQIATTEFVQQELTEVKKSVSDGKTTVANAITAKGVTTATDATFAAMAENISQIESGIDTSDATASAGDMLSGKTAYVDGNKITGTMANRGAVSATLSSGGSYTIPAGYHNGNGKITAEKSSGTQLNIFTQTSEPTKKDGIWVKTSNPYKKAIVDNRLLNEDGVWNDPVSDLPYNFYYGSAVVYNNEIHILGSSYNSSTYRFHYKWNGSSWTAQTNMPYRFYGGSAVVYNNEIHILGSSFDNDTATFHFKWNGSSWTSVSTLPYTFSFSSAVVYNGEIHILGRNNGGSSHYKWNGSSWTSVSTLPYGFSSGSAVVYNGEIHILGGLNNTIKHYKWNGSSWTSVSTIPYYFFNGSAVVYNNEIHIIGSSGNSSTFQAHYKWNGSSWTSVSTIPYYFFNGSAVVHNNEIHILGSSYANDNKSRATFTASNKAYDPYTLIIQRGDTVYGVYATALADMSAITGPNNRFQTGFDDVWYFGASAMESSPIYYGNGTSWIKLKN